MMGDTDLARLMNDLHYEDPDDMLCEPISRRVRMIKESPEEVENMCKDMDRIYNDTDKCRQVRVALNMINKNYSSGKIAEVSELTGTAIAGQEEEKGRSGHAAA